MKKILFTSLNDHTPWGGSEELWSKVAMDLSTHCQVSALVKKWEKIPKQINDLIENKISLIYKPITKQKSFKDILLDKIVQKIALRKAESRNDFDSIENIREYDLVVLSVGNHADPKIVEYTDYLKRLEKNYVVIIQLATDLRYLDDNIILKLKKAYENAECIYYLSFDNLKILEMQLGAQLTNVMKIDNPFNFKQNYVLPLDKHVYNVACVAALTTFHKGQELLLAAISKQKWQERNIVFNFYGTGINEMQIRRLIKIYKLEDKVNLKGYMSDKTEIWKENIACIMPSRMEGQSLAMLEAMSFGRVIISTRVGDAERFVRHNETGFLIDAPTVEHVDFALEQAWENRKNWIEMGKLSRNHLYNIIRKDPVVDFSEKLQILL